MTTTISAALAEILEISTALRRDLHRHPELQYQEHRTAKIVAEHLTRAGIEHKTGLAGGTGVLGYLPATTQDPAQAQTIALRADMDALPILEETGVEYASETPGVMHACGHDGHTSILLGTALWLNQQPRDRNVLFIFQPAEEGGAGGQRMCEDGVLNGSILGRPADVIFGLHCAPFLELGTAASRVGPMMASTDEVRITIHGQGGHAATPHFTNDVVVTAAHVITALQTVASRGVDPLDPVVVTIGQIHGGSANNVIPTSVFLHGTIRTLNAETRALARQRVQEIAERTAAVFGARAEVELEDGYPVTENHPQAFARVEAVAQKILGDGWGEFPPVMGGEDFSYYGHHVPACFYWLGIAPTGSEFYPQVHTPKFNFNDEAIPVGIQMMTELALRG